MSPLQRILIVGASGYSHLGASFLRGATKLGIAATLCDTKLAWQHHTLHQKILWRFCGRLPARLDEFGASTLAECDRFRATVLLTTGNAPLSAVVVRQFRERGARCINFSSDDPFNPRHRAPWFLRSLREYHTIFTPRRTNTNEFEQHGCADVRYLPFGYDPELFFRDPEVVRNETSDLFFAGTAEASRAGYVKAAVTAGFKVCLYGNYWNRYRETRDIALGVADIPVLRRAITSCSLGLCLVRHENRDGHSMRTFEMPAMGACLMVEDTADHREIFGNDEEMVCYFATKEELVAKTRRLLSEPLLRNYMRDKAFDFVTTGGNTYSDRLTTMLQ